MPDARPGGSSAADRSPRPTRPSGSGSGSGSAASPGGGTAPSASPSGAAPSAAFGRRSDRSGWNWLLLLPLLAVIYPPLYDRSDPWLFGLPFFYWYQLAVIALSVVCTLLVYRARRVGTAGRAGSAR